MNVLVPSFSSKQQVERFKKGTTVVSVLFCLPFIALSIDIQH